MNARLEGVTEVQVLREHMRQMLPAQQAACERVLNVLAGALAKPPEETPAPEPPPCPRCERVRAIVGELPNEEALAALKHGIDLLEKKP